jgi:alkanesulfonate monooxygenase SsuD/methylene tetrahydromethanopterin reductase-like flavin-dependent oxidoreductase (luciferase family)
VTLHIGATLPQFRADAEPCIEAARRAEALGLDGVFVFDHMWPLGNPDGAVLHSHTLLAAVAAETDRLRVGTLVARVGLMPDAVLANTLVSSALIAGRDRFVAGVGTGDAQSKPEDEAFGVTYEPVAERLARLSRVVGELRQRGVTTWIGGRSVVVRSMAAETADGLNIWAATPAEVASEVADLHRRTPAGRQVAVSWGGQVLIGRTDAEAAAKLERYGSRPNLVHGTVTGVARHFEALAEAGVTFVVCSPLDVHDSLDAYETLAEVREGLT